CSWSENIETVGVARANTWTTDGDTFLKIAMVAFSLAARSPRGVTARGDEAESHRAARYGSVTQKVASNSSQTIEKRSNRIGTLPLLVAFQCQARSKVPVWFLQPPSCVRQPVIGVLRSRCASPAVQSFGEYAGRVAPLIRLCIKGSKRSGLRY